MRENPDFFVGGPNVAVWGDSRCEGAAYITQALNPSVLDKWRDTLPKDAKDANAPHKEGSENTGETPSLYTETVGTTKYYCRFRLFVY